MFLREQVQKFKNLEPTEGSALAVEKGPMTVAPLEGKLQQDMSPERITIRGISLILCDHFYVVILSLFLQV